MESSGRFETERLAPFDPQLVEAADLVRFERTLWHSLLHLLVATVEGSIRFTLDNLLSCDISPART